MADFNELKPGARIIFEEEPWEILESQHVKMAQRRPIRQIKMRNLINGRTLKTTFHQGDYFDDAEIESREVKFVYKHRDQFCFVYSENPSERFFLAEELLGNAQWFLIPNTAYEASVFEEKIIGIQVPKKVALMVKSGPPGIKGDSEKSAFKEVELETGLTIKTPLFINTGERVVVNTETLEYVERAQ